MGKKSKTKFYKSTIVVTVLADEPIDFESLSDLSYKISEGGWIGEYQIKSHDSITSKEAADLATKLRSEPEFFGIDEDGNDV